MIPRASISAWFPTPEGKFLARDQWCAVEESIWTPKLLRLETLEDMKGSKANILTHKPRSRLTAEGWEIEIIPEIRVRVPRMRFRTQVLRTRTALRRTTTPLVVGWSNLRLIRHPTSMPRTLELTVPALSALITWGGDAEQVTGLTD